MEYTCRLHISTVLLVLLWSADLNDGAVGDWMKPSVDPYTHAGTLENKIGENQPVGQTPAYVEVEGGTSYKLLSPINVTFAIQTNGTLNITERLDYEKIISYILVIEAVSGNGATTATVTVKVEDKNDNPPVFPVAPYYIRLPDNVTEGTYVTTVYATDADRSFEYKFIDSYSLDGDDADNFFIVGTSGEVYVSKDRILSQSVKTNYTFKVKAQDNGTPYRFGSGDVTVCVGCLPNISWRTMPSILTIWITVLALFRLL